MVFCDFEREILSYIPNDYKYCKEASYEIYYKKPADIYNNDFLYWNKLVELSGKIINMRDRKTGLGKRDEAYHMLFIWYKYFPTWALTIFDSFIHENTYSNYDGIGCWSDVKYFCEFLRKYNCQTVYENICVENLTNDLIDIMNKQLQLDYFIWNSAISNYLKQRDNIFKNHIDVSEMGLPSRPKARHIISNACKWVPRERSRFGWLFEKMALRWARKEYPRFFCYKVCCLEKQQKLINKIHMMYRKMISSLYREIISYVTIH